MSANRMVIVLCYDSKEDNIQLIGTCASYERGKHLVEQDAKTMYHQVVKFKPRSKTITLKLKDNHRVKYTMDKVTCYDYSD